MQRIYLDNFIKGYARKAMYIQDITHHPQKHIIEERVKILAFYDEFGLKATGQAFSVSRATIFNWKKRLKTNQGRLSSLAPASRKPHTMRRSRNYVWHQQQLIKLRQAHPGLGKDKLKVFLDYDCSLACQPILSVSTIGRLLTQLQAQGKVSSRRQLSYISKTGRLVNKMSNKPRLKKIRRNGFKPQAPGDLVQVDCVIKIINGLRRYVISAIDYKSEFAFSYGYTSLSSTNATDFLVKLTQVAPFTIKRVQTDNGSEFYKNFHEATQKLTMTHYWNYPRSPKMNAKIERYNRTVQEEFIDWHLDDFSLDLIKLNDLLMDYLIWYNTERPHWTLQLKSPMQYLLEGLQLTLAESNMLWTNTQAV